MTKSNRRIQNYRAAGRVVDAERLRNSRNGNPRWRLVLDVSDGRPVTQLSKSLGLNRYPCTTRRRVVTPTDAGWVYGLDFDQLIGKEVEVLHHYTATGRFVLDELRKQGE